MASSLRELDELLEETIEPSVFSPDPEERKLARRLRIQRRQDALKKSDVPDSEPPVEESLTEKQIAQSQEVLEKLLAESDEVITNVRVANDARELERRKRESEARARLVESLEDNSAECRSRYEAIDAKWVQLLASDDPVDIHCRMQDQSERCLEVLDKKDAMIEELRRELQRADDKYFEDQELQELDLKLLTERIDNQMSTMSEAYKRELELIERALNSERDALLEGFEKKWNELYEEQERDQKVNHERRKEIVREYQEELHKLLNEHALEYRNQRLELESECRNMQLQIEQTKYLCLMNSEKLSYNYKILKNREEENSIVKSLQKRKISKLQSNINMLKKHLQELDRNSSLEIQKLTMQIKKYHRTICETEEKSDHFTRVNEKQYMDIWNLNSETANDLVHKILRADKMIHEQTLGILWEPPKIPIPKKEDMPSYCDAVCVIEKQTEEDLKKLKLVNGDVPKSPRRAYLEKRILQNILKQIADSTGFLLEEKLSDLVSVYDEDEKNIVKIDSIFQALMITRAEEINILLDFFLPYTYCPVCLMKGGNSSKSTSTTSRSEESSSSSKQSPDCRETCEGCLDDNVKSLIKDVKKEVELLTKDENTLDKIESKRSIGDSIEGEKGDSDIESDKNKNYEGFVCSKGHILEIQKECVIKVLTEIVEIFSKTNHSEMIPFRNRVHEKKYTISRNLTVEDVRKYWSTYKDIFTPEKERLWDAVLVGLSKYYEVLKERRNLCEEVDNLRIQNLELQKLLHTYTDHPPIGSPTFQIKSRKIERKSK